MLTLDKRPNTTPASYQLLPQSQQSKRRQQKSAIIDRRSHIKVKQQHLPDIKRYCKQYIINGSMRNVWRYQFEQLNPRGLGDNQMNSCHYSSYSQEDYQDTLHATQPSRCLSSRVNHTSHRQHYSQLSNIQDMEIAYRKQAYR